MRIEEGANFVCFRHRLAQKVEALASRSGAKKLTPVALPPGSFRLVTSPNRTGSPPTPKIMGMVSVAALATRL